MKHTIKCHLGKYPTQALSNIIIPDSPLKRRIKPGDTLSFVSQEYTLNCLALEASKSQTPCDGCFIFSNVATGIRCFNQCGGRCVVINADNVLEEL